MIILPKVCQVTNIRTISEALNKTPVTKTIQGEVHKQRRLYLTLPVAPAISKYTFSALQRLKTYLRSTMKIMKKDHLTEKWSSQLISQFKQMERRSLKKIRAGRYELNKLTSLPVCGFLPQLVEHCTGVPEVTGWNPVEALIFFRLLLSNWKINCDDPSLSSTTAVQIWIISYILHKDHLNYYLLLHCRCHKSITDTLNTVNIAKKSFVCKWTMQDILKNMSRGMHLVWFNDKPPPQCFKTLCHLWIIFTLTITYGLL